MGTTMLAEWTTGIPALLSDTAAAWDLIPGPSYPPGAAGHVVQAERADGMPAVLKLVYPHRESGQEADALERWDGDGAVQLLERDDTGVALLLERCEPGTFLSEASAPDALGVLIELLPRLWKSGEGFRTLAGKAEHWLLEAR